MRKLMVFNHVSLDGYFTGENGDLGWAYAGNEDPLYAAFVADNAGGESELLFGRVTYDMMAKYWPTPMADQHQPGLAARMNALPKVVFSKTLDVAGWNNTRLVKDDLIAAVKKLKSEEGPGMVILGSGTIIAQLAAANLIDEYQIMLDPVALGKGRSMFEGMPAMLSMKLTKSRSFDNGKLFLCFEPGA